MAAKAPNRRFAPVPVETSTKHSRNVKSSESVKESKPTRKFVVEPVETTTRHKASDSEPPRREDGQQQITPPPTPDRQPRRFVVEPVETSTKHSRQEGSDNKGTEGGDAVTKKPRRFAVEPVESTVKHSRQSDGDGTTPKGPRKFAVQPVESSSHHRKVDSSDSDGTPKRRFAPQPVENAERRHRSSDVPRRRDSELDETPADLPQAAKSNKPVRKFAVELVDISARTRRASDEMVSMPHKFRTDVTPGHLITSDGQTLFPATAMRRKPLLHERRLERRGPENNARSHSFIAPDLETIESSESDQSETGSPLRSDTPSTAANDSPLTISDGLSEGYQVPKKTSQAGPSFSQFLLEAEAKRAEQRLREQALAAFPNSDFHEPVHHYVDDSDSEEVIVDDRPATWEGHDDDDEELTTPNTWRKNTNKVDWELIEIRKHHEALEKKRAAAEAAAARKQAEQKPSPWWNPGAVKDLGAAGGDSELSQMRKGARPPMLGADLVFPRSQSPTPARFDITQGSHVLRSQMCYLTEQADVQSGQKKDANGLWGGAHSPNKSPSDGKGLWGGFCAASRNSSGHNSSLPSGLVTPAVLEPANPFDESLPTKYPSNSLRPPTPPHTRSKMLDQGIVAPRIDSVLNTDEELDRLMKEEYPDEFVTQVFNYLSLGYPTLARPFDDELSKITSISITELRSDDSMAKSLPKGYIRIGDDFQGRDDGSNQDLQPDKCVRWRALKQYIREWARQEKGMIQIRQAPFGTAPRKGSWAW